jgi:predicted DNA-binding transcriptional regulator AlpA
MSTEAKAAKRELPLLVKIPATAREFSASVSKIYELVNAGKLDLVKLGPKMSRITSESIERLLAERAKPDTNVPNLKQFRETRDMVSGD